VKNMAIRGTVEDGFEDGDYSSNPSWTEDGTAGGTISIQGTTVKKGSYAFEFESDGQGDSDNGDIYNTDLDPANLVDGLVFQAWIRQSNVNVRVIYVISSPNGWIGIRSTNGSGDAQYNGDAVAGWQNLGYTLSADTWYKFKIVWHPASIDFILEDATGTELASATGIDATADYDFNEVKILNRDDVTSVVYNYVDGVSFRTCGSILQTATGVRETINAVRYTQ